jgi:phosphoenolpyruvate phosphomutase
LETLNEILRQPRVSVLGGAHDALSARLVAEAGFDGVWASSFGISLAAHCLPDTDLITMSENADAVRRMTAATRIPVVADVSAGYGNAINVQRLVREFERAGAAAICMEDYPFPKRCSLYEGWPRVLLDVDEMAGKVEAAKAAQEGDDFVVIARVEALIADLGVDEAVTRANAYEAAGADALLVHSRSFAPLREFTQRWTGTCPLVVVPTLFPEVTAEELEQCGFRLAIFPNQAIRAAIRSMRETLAAIRASGNGRSVQDEIAPLTEVYRIVDLDAVLAAELEYVVRAPVAAAASVR